MTDKLRLTFGTLIAHFLPGLIILLSIVAAVDNKEDIKTYIENYQLTTVTVGVLLSLIFGLLIDAIRFLLTLLPKGCKCYREWSHLTVEKATEDDRKYHDWIIENHFRFHQFYGNLGLGILASSIILKIKNIELEYLWVLYPLSAICILSAIFTLRTTINNLKKRFSKEE
ncbi:MAG: hypothetical protein H8D55_02610 [Deltaproteobacteria bacterium]|nr:hypothetical protein [Deltaproteobacteria bacterium]